MKSFLLLHPKNPSIVYMVDPEDPQSGFQEQDPVLVNVHAASKCAGNVCIVHNPSDHHMRTWAFNWRNDAAKMERLCPHGIGHPDPDSFLFRKKLGISSAHGCDGCCIPPHISEEDVDD